jgi:hypothetical protein
MTLTPRDIEDRFEEAASPCAAFPRKTAHVAMARPGHLSCRRPSMPTATHPRHRCG